MLSLQRHCVHALLERQAALTTGSLARDEMTRPDSWWSHHFSKTKTKKKRKSRSHIVLLTDSTTDTAGWMTMPHQLAMETHPASIAMHALSWFCHIGSDPLVQEYVQDGERQKNQGTYGFFSLTFVNTGVQFFTATCFVWIRHLGSRTAHCACVWNLWMWTRYYSLQCSSKSTCIVRPASAFFFFESARPYDITSI